MSYDLEKKISKTPEKFGKGVDQGLSSPEAANNASMGGSLVPLFSLGIPGSGTAAILLGALIMLGLQPGPLMFEKSGDIIWALIAGLMIANVILLLMNTLLVPMFTIIIEKTDKYLVPIVSVFCFIGVYVISNSLLDVFVMILFGILGYFFIKLRFSLATFILAVILGTMIESNFRRSLIMSNDQLSIFFTRPISLIFMLLTIAALVLPIIRAIYKSRKTSY